MTSTSGTYKKVLKHFNRRNGSKNLGANVLGLHVEGPFISKDKKGAHTPEHLRCLKNGFKDVQDMFGDENIEKIDIITLAPELDEDGKRLVPFLDFDTPTDTY